MMSLAVRVGLVCAHIAFCLCVTAQTVKVTFDDVKGFSTPTNPPGGEVRHFATTPEGGRYTASRGIFYTGCQCVPDDATTVYGAVARVNQPDVVMDFGPLPSTAGTARILMQSSFSMRTRTVAHSSKQFRRSRGASIDRGGAAS